MMQLVKLIGWNVALILRYLSSHANYRVFYIVAPSVFSQVDMFLTIAAHGGRHFIYVYLCSSHVATYIVKLDAL